MLLFPTFDCPFHTTEITCWLRTGLRLLAESGLGSLRELVARSDDLLRSAALEGAHPCVLLCQMRAVIYGDVISIKLITCLHTLKDCNGQCGGYTRRIRLVCCPTSAERQIRKWRYDASYSKSHYPVEVGRWKGRKELGPCSWLLRCLIVAYGADDRTTLVSQLVLPPLRPRRIDLTVRRRDCRCRLACSYRPNAPYPLASGCGIMVLFCACWSLGFHDAAGARPLSPIASHLPAPRLTLGSQLRTDVLAEQEGVEGAGSAFMLSPTAQRPRQHRHCRGPWWVWCAGAP